MRSCHEGKCTGEIAANDARGGFNSTDIPSVCPGRVVTLLENCAGEPRDFRLQLGFRTHPSWCQPDRRLVLIMANYFAFVYGDLRRDQAGGRGFDSVAEDGS